MAEKSIKAFINAIATDPKAKELLKGTAQPEDLDAEIRIYADIARQLGYDVTEEELKAYLEKFTGPLKERTEEAVAGIQELPDETLEHVAGGTKEHDNCKDTYRNYENCWVNDGCDSIYHKYSDYVCHKLAWDNPCHETAEPCSHGAYCVYTDIW